MAVHAATPTDWTRLVLGSACGILTYASIVVQWHTLRLENTTTARLMSYLRSYSDPALQFWIALGVERDELIHS